MTFVPRKLLVLGCGYVGRALSSRVLARGIPVLGTTRGGREAELRAAGITPLSLAPAAVTGRGVDDEGALLDLLSPHVDEHTALVVTFPPDGATDAQVAELARRAGASVYVSSTGVYGDRRGLIDDRTEPAPDSPRTTLRLRAEELWRSAGATVLRVAAIYGPGRGQHVRVRDGSARIAGDGSQSICRIHVDDLVTAIWRSLELRLGPESYVIADDEPAPQGEVVRYLAELLRVPVPPAQPLDEVSETLRHDRRVDASRFKQHASVAWQYPTYRAGFAACLAAEASASAAAPAAHRSPAE
jgi:nucleoside-diphosphate-sugar epimerase